MSETTLKNELKSAKDGISDVDDTPEKLREKVSGDEAKAIRKEAKEMLNTVFTGVVATPQDGGAGMLAQITANISSL